MYIGSAIYYQYIRQMSRQVWRGSDHEYQADEQAGVVTFDGKQLKLNFWIQFQKLKYQNFSL